MREFIRHNTPSGGGIIYLYHDEAKLSLHVASALLLWLREYMKDQSVIYHSISCINPVGIFEVWLHHGINIYIQ